MKFNIEHYSDGLKRKYGNVYEVDLDEAVEELIYYDFFSNLYDEDGLTEYLTNLKPGYTMRGSRWSEFKITKK